MSASKLEEFVASVPSMATSDLLTILFTNDTRTNLYTRVANDGDSSYSDSMQKIREATDAIVREIDLRIPPRSRPASHVSALIAAFGASLRPYQAIALVSELDASQQILFREILNQSATKDDPK
jgi:hypothetical protein